MLDFLLLVSEAWAQTSGTEVPATPPIEVSLVSPPSPPIFERWQFWQVVITGGLALAGFTWGTRIKYNHDLKLDRERRDQEAKDLAAELHAELRAVWGDLRQGENLLEAWGQGLGDDDPTQIFKWNWELLDPVRMQVFEAQIGKLGLLDVGIATEAIDLNGRVTDLRKGVERVLRHTEGNEIFTTGQTIDHYHKNFVKAKEAVEKLNAPLATEAGVEKHDWSDVEAELDL